MRITKKKILIDYLRTMKPGEQLRAQALSPYWSRVILPCGTHIHEWHLGEYGKHIRKIDKTTWERTNSKIRKAPAHLDGVFANTPSEINSAFPKLPYKLRINVCQKLGAENPYDYMEYISVPIGPTIALLKKYRSKKLGKKYMFPQRTSIILGIGGWELLAAMVGLTWNGEKYEIDLGGSDKIIQRHFFPVHKEPK